MGAHVVGMTGTASVSALCVSGGTKYHMGVQGNTGGRYVRAHVVVMTGTASVSALLDDPTPCDGRRRRTGHTGGRNVGAHVVGMTAAMASATVNCS